MAKPERRSPHEDEDISIGTIAAIALAISVFSFVLHSAALSYDFVNWDDWTYVLYNPQLETLDLAFFRWALTTQLLGNWHPATLISFGLDHWIWQKDAYGYHLTNVLLHAVNCGLVMWVAWLLLRRISGRNLGSIFGATVLAALFACHPLHVESVAWISERKDVLYAFFWFGSLIAWLGYIDCVGSGRKRNAHYILSLVLFAFSTMSKPMAVTFPLLLVILDLYPLKRFPEKQILQRGLRMLLIEKLPFFAISLAIGLATLATQGESGAIGHSALSLVDRLWVSERALAFYLLKFVAPVQLVPLYPADENISPSSWPYWSALLCLLGLLLLCVRTWRRFPVIPASLTFYFVSLLPVLGLIEFGNQSAADRYAYLALLGPGMIVAALGVAAWNAGTHQRQLAIAVALLVTSLLAWRTTTQLLIWRDSEALWEHVVSFYPNSVTAHYNLGQANVIAGHVNRGEAEWRRSLEIESNHIMALYELGALLGRAKEFDEAEGYFRSVVRLDPAHAMARVNLAMLLDQKGDWNHALEHYRVFLRVAGPTAEGWVAQVKDRLREVGVEATP